MEIQTLNERQQKVLIEKTPKKFIKQRVGRGGKTLSYVETGYIISKLNELFNYLWSFEITDQVVGTGQVYVKGRITATILIPSGMNPLTQQVIKANYGGSDIKRYDKTYDTVSRTYIDHPKKGEPIDIGDDLKAATSDCLKKCASMFGISADVYWPGGQDATE